MNGSYFLKLELTYPSPVFSAYISLPLAKLGNYFEADSCASKVHNFSTRIFIVSKYTCIVFLVLCHILTHWNVTILSQSIKTIDTQGRGGRKGSSPHRCTNHFNLQNKSITTKQIRDLHIIKIFI